MTVYDYLLKNKESGELSILLQIGLPVNILAQMDIYAYHLAHPCLSQFQVAMAMRTHKYVVWLAYCAMSRWNTIFVEVPVSTFNPVKTVNDLLREQHQ